MHKPDFEKCTKLATDLLHEQTFNDTLINVRTMKFNKTIIFDTLQNYCKITGTSLEQFLNSKKKILKEGCTIIYDGVYIVLYNEKFQSLEHLNWTLAHEIGHIYLGHIKDGAIEEVEAHYFAAQLLMPEYTILQMRNIFKSVSSKDIYMIFNVSSVAAKKRMSTINKKTSFQCSQKHVNIWKKQEKYIEFYYNYKKINTGCSPEDKINLRMSYDCDYDYYLNRFNDLSFGIAE